MKGIYLITNKINGKKYVGLSNNINRRFAEHKCSLKNKTTVLSKAFRKYSIENFEFEILEIVEDVKNLSDREIFWINKINPEYNMNEGGVGNKGYIVSNELKNHLRILGKIQWQSKTDIEKQEIIVKNLKGPAFNRIVSEETKQKLRLANIGKKQSQETKSKISSKNKVSMIGNKSGNKPVIAYNDNEEIEFESGKIAADSFGVNPTCITGVLKGRRLTSCGYKWKYKNQ
jgi:group I intron endonuclease